MSDTNIQKYLQQAKDCDQAGDKIGAIANYRSAIELDANQPVWVYQALCHQLLNNGQINDGEQIYQLVLEKYPDKPTGYAGLASTAQRQQRWELALQRWDECLEKFPQQASWWWHVSKGNTLIELKRFEEAEAVFSAAANQYPNDSHVFAKLASVTQLRKQWELALQRWNECLEKFPNQASWWWYVGKGDSLIELQRFEEAEAVFSAAANKYPNQPECLVGLAKIAQRQQQLELALQRWNECLEKFPQQQSWWWHVSKGHTLIGLQRFEEAEAVFSAAVNKYPNQPECLVSLAQIAQRQQQWELALQRWDECLEKFPQSVSNQQHVLAGQAQAARMLGQYERCLKYCHELIARFPEVATGYREAQQAYIELGQFEQATKMFLAIPASKQPVIIPKLPANYPQELILPSIIGNGNDYSFIEDKVKQFVNSGQAYSLAVSIIIPVYNRKQLLAKVLASLTHQTYPMNLMEVVVVDDGSYEKIEPVIRKYEGYLPLKYLRQSDRGYRLAEARNFGMRAARHDYFIILDGDVIAVPKLVESYMQLFHVYDHIVMTGQTRFICTDSITDDEVLEDINVCLNLPDIINENMHGTIKLGNGSTVDCRLPGYIRTNFLKNERFSFNYIYGAIADKPFKNAVAMMNLFNLGEQKIRNKPIGFIMLAIIVFRCQA